MNYKLLKEMIDCVKREVSLRRSVYPKLINSGKMKQEQAEKEINLMYLVQLSLQKIYDRKAPEEVQGTLFDMKEFQSNKTMEYFLKGY